MAVIASASSCPRPRASTDEADRHPRHAGWRHPEQHLARRVEARTPAEMMNLLTLDALIATYGMDAGELRELMLLVRSLYRAAVR